MCLILMAYREIDGVDLLLASNRDERYDRPASYASLWPDWPTVLAGRDLKGGGTWLAVSQSGRLAAVTNIREPENIHSGAPSRGVLPLAFMEDNDTVYRFVARSPSFEEYNGFNLILWDGETLAVASNRIGAPISLDPGIHGISNGLPESKWPKVDRGVRRLRRLVESGDTHTESILKVMQSEGRERDEILPDTGVGLEMERVLSPAFIRMEGYGTRCTTIVQIQTDGAIEFDEFSYRGSTDVVNHVHVELDATVV